MGAGQRDEGHVHARFGPGRAAGLAKAAVGAGRAPAEAGLMPCRRKRRVGGRRGANAQAVAGTLHQQRGTIERQRCQRIGRSRRAPRIIRRPGNTEKGLELAIIGREVRIADRPVHPDPELAVEPKIVGLGARCVGRIVQRRAADPDARVVLPEGQRIAAARQAFVEPEQLVLLGLVGREILGRRPFAPGFERDDAEPGLGETGSGCCAAGTRADDHDIDGAADIVPSLADHEATSTGS